MAKYGTALNPGVASNVPQDELGKWLANKLGGGRDWLNQNLGIPGIETGIGLGDLFMGESPEFIEDVSWGQPISRPGGHGPTLDPRIMDVAGLPIPYAGAAKGMQLGGRALLKQGATPDLATLAKTDPVAAKKMADARVNSMFDDTIPRNQVDQGRRDALKAIAGGTAVAAAPLTALKALKSSAAKPHPYYSEAVVADLARPMAGATVRAATAAANPQSAGLAAYIRSVPTALAAFKDKGVKGVQDLVENATDDRYLMGDMGKGEYIPSYIDMEGIDEDAVRRMVLDDSPIQFIDEFLKNKPERSGDFFSTEADLFVTKADVDDWVEDPEGVGYDIWSAIVDTNAKTLKEAEELVIRRAVDEDSANQLRKIFDDPLFEEKFIDHHNRATAHFNDEIGYDVFAPDPHTKR